MKKAPAGLCVVALLCLVPLLPPVHGQAAAATRDSVRPFSYRLSDEVTLKGTVSNVLTKPAQGMIMGSHLLVSTSSGTVDASLGTFGLGGRDPMQVKAGEQVEMTGIMKTIKGRQVFLTRLVKADNQTYRIRNEHGFLVAPSARSGANRRAARNGEAL